MALLITLRLASQVAHAILMGMARPGARSASAALCLDNQATRIVIRSRTRDTQTARRNSPEPASRRWCNGADALMPWCYAVGNGLVRLVGRLPVGMGALSDTAALGDRGMSVLQRSCSARDEGRWRVREGGGAMALMPWCDAARTALVGLVGRLPIGMGALSDTAAPLVQPSVTPSLAHNRPRMAQIGHAASSVPWTVLWLSAEQITNGMRSEDVAPVQTEAAWLCVDP